MTLVETLALDITQKIVAKVNLTIPQRREITQWIVSEFAPLVPEPQERLNFDTEEKKSDDQRARILALLKARRQEGVTNVEFSAICLNYTARISELRQKPYFYTIICTKEKGRVTRYRLHAFQW